MRSSVYFLRALMVFAASTFAGLGQPRGFAHLLLPAPIRILGRVVDSEGRPIHGVRVEHLAIRGRISVDEFVLETDSNGRFSAETQAPVIVPRKEGLESQFIRISADEPELRIAMKPAPAPDRIPVLRKPAHCVSVGGTFCLPKVKGVDVGDIGGFDARERSFTVRGRPQMIHGVGTSWGGPAPRSEDVWSSIEYKERTLTGGGIQVIDASGKTADSRVWRSVGVRDESAFYSGVDLKSAAIMDRILDGLCLVSGAAPR